MSKVLSFHARRREYEKHNEVCSCSVVGGHNDPAGHQRCSGRRLLTPGRKEARFLLHGGMLLVFSPLLAACPPQEERGWGTGPLGKSDPKHWQPIGNCVQQNSLITYIQRYLA